ncbi:beta-glucuronidase [Enterocloster bolteae]|uniref:beta-glucuronidase n=1 Tax=Enterocloster bolteae TaxID=208479 RepID=UPI002A841A92|nr:beta-glucuronidase [Enterocloster bolteae]
MLSVRQNESRMAVELGGIWNFKLDQEASSAQVPMPGVLRDAEPVAVPASYNDQKDIIEYRDHYGWAYYQRTLTVPVLLKGQRLWLRFGAVAHSAMVWLGDTLLCTHKGGFLPFEAEITDLAEPGSSLLLTVAVDNRLDHSTLPAGNDPTETAFFGSDNAGIPSVEQAKREQKLQNRPNFDFFNYAGIFRPVYLYTTPRQFIKDITLVPDMEGKVEYEIETEGQGDVAVQILDREGNVAARSQGRKGVIVIQEPHLWEPWPGTPYLYTARVTLAGEDGTDRYEQPFGLRTVEVKGKQFLLNGKPFYFKGFGKHEDSFFRGRGLDLCLDVKDVNLIHWLGANSFRTSHYPYAEEMYDLCDREGIVIIDETTAVGLNMGGNGNPYTFGTREHHEQVIKELIQRDKNHPCVVMWSLGNEPDLEHYPQEAYDYWHPLYDLAHREDPQDRPVTLVCCQNDYTKDITTRTMDVVCLNRYYGWYNLGGDLDAACNGWNMELDFWAGKEKPVMLTEYGADAVAGIHQMVPGMFSEEYQAQYYERINSENDKRPFFVGEQIWNFADFVTVQGPMRVGGNRKGIFTRERTPKLAAHTLRRRWNGIPNFGYK